MKALLVTAAILFTASCAAEEEGTYVDFGTGSGQGYKPLADGDDCEVVYAVQGGYWIMLRLDANLPSESIVQCGLEVNGSVIAEQRVALRDSVQGGVFGALNMVIYPGEPNLVPPLSGEEAFLYCEYEGQSWDRVVNLDVLPIE